jgi:hypothetical protein
MSTFHSKLSEIYLLLRRSVAWYPCNAWVPERSADLEVSDSHAPHGNFRLMRRIQYKYFLLRRSVV